MTTHLEATNILADLALIPFNSAAGIMRLAGADYDQRKYGTDCAGKLPTIPYSA